MVSLSFCGNAGLGKGIGSRFLGEQSAMGHRLLRHHVHGAVAVPILTEFPAQDIARIIHHSGARGIFVSRRFFDKLECLAAGDRSICILLDDWTAIPPGAAQGDLSRTDTPRGPVQRLGSERSAEADERGPAPEDLAAVVYTSGTTGFSKGVMLTHRNLVSDAIATAAISGVRSDDRLLSILPLAHTYESTLGLITIIMIGATVYYLDSHPRPCTPASAGKGASDGHVVRSSNHRENLSIKDPAPAHGRPGSAAAARYYCRPTRVAQDRWQEASENLWRELRLFTIGGAPLAPDVELFLREARFPYAIGYGLTETAPLIAGTGSAATRYRSTGPALPGTSIRIANANPATGEGEIEVKGPTVMKDTTGIRSAQLLPSQKMVG